jgi:hypothetical protein
VNSGQAQPGKGFKIAPPRHGLAWLINSFSLIRMQPFRLLFIVVILQFIISLTQLQLIGFLVVLSMPGLTAGMLEALRQVSRGGPAAPYCLFIPLTSARHVGRLLLLGGIVFIAGATSIMLMLSGGEATVDPGILERIEGGDASALQEIDPAAVQRLLAALLVGVAVSGTLSFFSIPLIWFRDLPLGTALKTGISALIANWKAFAVLALGLLAIAAPITVVLSFLVTAGPGSSIAVLGMFLLLLGFQLVLFSSQYCSFLDIFPDQRETGTNAEAGMDDKPNDGNGGGDDSGQLIA